MSYPHFYNSLFKFPFPAIRNCCRLPSFLLLWLRILFFTFYNGNFQTHRKVREIINSWIHQSLSTVRNSHQLILIYISSLIILYQTSGIISFQLWRVQEINSFFLKPNYKMLSHLNINSNLLIATGSAVFIIPSLSYTFLFYSLNQSSYRNHKLQLFLYLSSLLYSTHVHSFFFLSFTIVVEMWNQKKKKKSCPPFCSTSIKWSATKVTDQQLNLKGIQVEEHHGALCALDKQAP